jgi:UDP-N-acetylmuramoyl-tripeptide--D-alanyl-D-alanine ligase
VAIGVALDAPLAAMARRAPQVAFSRLRGELLELGNEIVVINDCYNANPVSMRAALDHLAGSAGTGRRLAILGGMAELGPDASTYHREAGAHARRLGISPLIGVGDLARDYAPDYWVADVEGAVRLGRRTLEPGDLVLVKGSRAIGLERWAEGMLSAQGR